MDLCPRRFFLSSLFPLAVSAVLLGSLPTCAQKKRDSTPVQHSKVPSSSVARSPRQTETLTRVIQAQEAAVQSGNPAEIQAASMAMNAKILEILASFRIAQGKTDQAAELYRQALFLEDSPALHLDLGSLNLRRGNFVEAETEANALTSSDPQNAAAWALLGSSLRLRGNNQDAVRALSRALDLHPDMKVAYTLGSALLALHEAAKAQQIFNRILSASQNSSVWQLAIGDAYRENGDPAKALEYMRAAVKQDPRVPHGEFFLGLTYLQMNQWGPNPDSLKHLRRAVAINPKDYLNNFYLGAMEATEGADLPSSNLHLHAAASADPSHPEVWLYLGQNAARQKHSAEAEAFLRKAIDLTGTHESSNNYQIRRAYSILGRLLIAEGNAAEGERLLTRFKQMQQLAIAEAAQGIAQTQAAGAMDDPRGSLAADLGSVKLTAAPDSSNETELPSFNPEEERLCKLLASGYNDLGTAVARQQQYGKALEYFQQAEQWGGPSATILHNAGTAAYRIGNSAEAERALGRYFALLPTPNAPRARIMLAMSQFDLGHFTDAAQNFEQAGDLAKTDPRTAYSYAFSLARTGKAQEANVLANQLSASSLPSDILSLVCHLYLDAENYEGSAACYRKAYTQDPTLRIAHYQVGESLLHLDRPSDAIPELRQELLLSPGEPNVEAALAFALLQTSQKTEARSILEKTVAEHPEHSEAQYQYGKLLLEEGNLPEAISHLEASEKADASKAFTHYQLATAYRKSGRSADAAREFGAYRELKEKRRNEHAIPQPVK